MLKLVLMVIVAFGPTSNNSLKELWRIEKNVSLEHCLIMNKLFARGGSTGVIIVRCEK